MITCRCGATDDKCLVRRVWVEKSERPSLWFETHKELGVGTFSLYLDANAIVELVNELRAALVRMTNGETP